MCARNKNIISKYVSAVIKQQNTAILQIIGILDPNQPSVPQRGWADKLCEENKRWQDGVAESRHQV